MVNLKEDTDDHDYLGQSNEGFSTDETTENATEHNDQKGESKVKANSVKLPDETTSKNSKIHRIFNSITRFYKKVELGHHSDDGTLTANDKIDLTNRNRLNNVIKEDINESTNIKKSQFTENMINNFQTTENEKGSGSSLEAHTNRGFVASSEDEIHSIKLTTTNSKQENTTKEIIHALKSQIEKVEPTSKKLSEEKPILWPQIFGTVSSATVHLAIGCVIGLTGVTLPSLMDPESEDLTLDKFQASIFSSIVNIGAIGGSILSSLMMTWLGQRSTLLVYLPIGILFWIILAFAQSFWLLVLCRVIQGIVIGVSAGCANNYVVETVHKNVRGRLFALIDLSRQVGFLFMYVVGSSQLSWRNVSLICGVISMALPFLGMVFLPHSPRWLATRGRKEEARNALVFFRGVHFDVEPELNDVQEQLEKAPKGAKVWDQLKMLTERSIAIRFLVLSILLFASHFTGNFALIAYSVSIFESAEVQMNPYLSTVLVACVRILGVVIYMTIADKFGRRPLLMIPLFLSGVAMVALGFFFYVKIVTGDTSNIFWLPLTSVMLYVIFTMMSHPVLMLLRSELLPTSVRAVGVGLLYLFFFCGSFGVSISYPNMVDSLGSHWTFWLYGATSFTMVAIIAVAIPETQGKSLEDIGELFQKKKVEDEA